MKTIFVVDDHQTVCEAIADKLQRDASMNQIDELTVVPLFSLADLEHQLMITPYPDLIMLDLTLGECAGIATLERVDAIFNAANQSRLPSPQTIPLAIFSGIDFQSREGAELLRTALNDFGVRGVLLKSGVCEKMFVGLSRILAGESWIPEELMRSLLAYKPSVDNSINDLTPREWDVAMWISKGAPNKTIAKELDLQEGYVRQIVGKIFDKLNVKNRTEAALIFNQHGATSRPHL